MSEYFGNQKRGGQINSTTSNQDSLASVYAVRQLSDKDIFRFGIEIEDFSLQCETDDDICIVSRQNKIFIQVKTGKIAKKEFYEILQNFKHNASIETRECFFVIAVFQNIIVNKKNIATRFSGYRMILNDPNESDSKKESIKQELINDFELNDYSELIDRIYFDEKPLFRDNQDTFAIFASYLRLVYGFKNQKEYYIKEVYNTLISEIEYARRNRGSIPREKIEEIIGKYLVKDTIFDKFDLMIGYKKIDIGYVPKKIDTKVYEIEKGVRKASALLLSDWRKAYYKEALFSFFFGALRCRNCSHSLVANCNGLRGMACPDCGYSPFVTIFVGCECGRYDVIQAQPELESHNIVEYINNYFIPNKKCKHCNRLISDEFIEARVFFAPVPYPFENYKKY